MPNTFEMCICKKVASQKKILIYLFDRLWSVEDCI